MRWTFWMRRSNKKLKFLLRSWRSSLSLVGYHPQKATNTFGRFDTTSPSRRGPSTESFSILLTGSAGWILVSPPFWRLRARRRQRNVGRWTWRTFKSSGLWHQGFSVAEQDEGGQRGLGKGVKKMKNQFWRSNFRIRQLRASCSWVRQKFGEESSLLRHWRQKSCQAECFSVWPSGEADNSFLSSVQACFAVVKTCRQRLTCQGGLFIFVQWKTLTLGFPCFTPEFCKKILEEVKNYQQSGLPERPPNSMNNHGLSSQLANRLYFCFIWKNH